MVLIAKKGAPCCSSLAIGKGGGHDPQAAPLRQQRRPEFGAQALGARFAAELFEYATPEVDAFRAYYEAADRRPELVAQASTKTSPAMRFSSSVSASE